MTVPTNDAGLIALYQALVADAALLNVLLMIHTEHADLSQRYLMSLQDYLEPLLPDLALEVPRDFVLKLYASSALTAITWALAHGNATDIATFMNRLAKNMLIR